jgi:heme exporter protein CcmD
MESLSLHDFVGAAYSVAGFVLGLFIVATLWRRARARRILARLEEKQP